MTLHHISLKNSKKLAIDTFHNLEQISVNLSGIAVTFSKNI